MTHLKRERTKDDVSLSKMTLVEGWFLLIFLIYSGGQFYVVFSIVTTVWNSGFCDFSSVFTDCPR